MSLLQVRAFIDGRLAQLEREYREVPGKAANGVDVALGRAVIAGQQMALRDLKRRIEDPDGAPTRPGPSGVRRA